MHPSPLVPRPLGEDPKKDRVERTLHDMTNGLSAVRSYGEILLRRTRAGTGPELEPIVESLLSEIDKIIALTKDVRRDTYHKGDVLSCTKCGYAFVQLKSSGPAPPCRRCKSPDVVKWKPQG